MNKATKYDRYVDPAIRSNDLASILWSELIKDMQVLIDYHQYGKKPTRIEEHARIVQKSPQIVTVAYTNGRVESFSYADYLTRQVMIKVVGVSV